MGGVCRLRAQYQPGHAAYREEILSDADLADIYAYLQSIPKPPDANSIPLLK